MKKIEWEMGIGFPTAMRYGEIEMNDDTTNEEIEEAVWEEVMSFIDYSWEITER